MPQQINNLKNEDQFIKELVDTFPEIKNEVLDEDYAGLITLQIGCFRNFTQRAIDGNDISTVKACFEFVEANVDKVEHKIENSLFISYLGKLRIVKNSKTEKLLPERLKNVVDQLSAYHSQPSRNDKLNEFLKGL